MSNPILRVRDLSVVFDGASALSHIEFTIDQGESVALIGPNGSGKTTLLRALIGSVPVKGTIEWAPQARIGYVPQRIDLERTLPLTLADFLFGKLKLAHRPSSSVYEFLDVVHLPHETLTKRLGSLSAGQLQRALIAFALIGDPNVLLFDEPTAGVDLPREEAIYDTIHRLQDERALTLILVSHDLNLVYRYATAVLCLNQQVVCYGVPQRVLTTETLSRLYGERVLYHHEHDH